MLAAGAALLILASLAVLAGPAGPGHRKEAAEGGFQKAEAEKITQELRESAWTEQQGEYVQAHLFSYENDYWHGMVSDGEMKGFWGTYSVTGKDTFTVTAYPGCYCDFAGAHRYRLKGDSLQIDGVSFQRADYDTWMRKAYAGDPVPEDAIEGEE